MATLLESFVVGLKAAIDRQSFSQFAASIKDIRGHVEKLTFAFGGLATGVVAIADHFSRLSYEARNVGSSVSGISKITYAVEQMGASGHSVKSALNSLYDFLHFRGPRAEQVIQQLGVATRDSQHHFRDTADILTDLGYAFRNLTQYGGQYGAARAHKFAEYLGIDDDLFKALIANPDMIKKFEKQNTDLYKAFGMDPNQAGKDGQKMMQDMRRLGLAMEIMGQKLATSLVHAFGGKDLNSFTNSLVSHSDEIASTLDKIVKIGTEGAYVVEKIASGIDKVVSTTIGWKHAIEAALGVFAASKVWALLSPLLEAGASLGGGLAALLGLPAETGGAVLTGVRIGGYESYRHWGDIKNGSWGKVWGDVKGDMTSLWTGAKSLFTSSQAHAAGNPLFHNPEFLRRQAEAMAYFESKGITKAGAAGLVGNLVQESGLGLLKGGDGVGIAQWHKDRVDKIRRQLGIDVRSASFEDQLKAVWLEMSTGLDKGGKTAWDKLSEIKNPYIAASAARYYWERPKNARHLEDYWRGGYALQAYNSQPTMNNNITINAKGNGNPREIADAVGMTLNQAWRSWGHNVSPRRLVSGAS
jgi:hypothetical protein